MTRTSEPIRYYTPTPSGPASPPPEFTAVVLHNGLGPCDIYPLGEPLTLGDDAPYLVALSAIVEEQAQDLGIPFDVIPPGVHRLEQAAADGEVAS